MRETIYMDSIQSKTFCIYPWIHQMASPTGRIKFCCVASNTNVSKDDGPAFDLNRDSFQEAWNSNYMQEVRKKMLAGEKIKGCDICYKQEMVGKKSYRQMHNDEWMAKLGQSKIKSRLAPSKKGNYIVNEPAAYLDLRLGNLCNLKCRMCNPYNSTQIEKEWNKLDVESNGGYSAFWKKYGVSNGGCSNWYESENFWKSTEKLIPNLEKVYMTGGEPTLIEGNYRFLQACKDYGRAKDIELFFNINFTNLRDSFIESINDFKWVSINASFDGVGAMNDYIRSPSKWSVCSENFKKLAKLGGDKIGLGLSPVVMSYNILQLDKVLQFVEEMILEYNRPVLIDFLVCFEPLFLDAYFLPDSIKQLAVDRLETFKKQSKTIHRKTQDAEFMRNSVESQINRLNLSMGEESPEKINDFLAYTALLDKKRRQNFRVACPEVSIMLEEAGYNLNPLSQTEILL